MKRVILLSIIGAAVVLSGCGGDNGEVTDTSVNETAPEQPVIVTETFEAVTSETGLPDETGFTGQTASYEDISRLTEENELPEISISEDMSFDDIMLAWQNAGEYYGRAAKEFFGFGAELNWKISDEWVEINGIGGIAPYLVNSGYRKALGFIPTGQMMFMHRWIMSRQGSS